MNTYSKNNTTKFVQLSLFIAIILIQSWVPFLGFINLGILSVTIIPVTVILGTLWLGTKEGTILGFVFGLNSFVRAWLIGNPVERLVFTSPLVSIIPRILMPLIVGLVVHNLMKKQNGYIKGFVAGLLGSALNTVLVLGSIGLFKPSEFLLGQDASTNIWPFLGAIVTTNGIPEAIFAAIVTPIIYLAINRARKIK